MTEERCDILNLRRSARYIVLNNSAVRLRITATTEEGPSGDVELVDISAYGLKVKLVRPLALHQLTTIELDADEGNIRVVVEAEVCWTRPCDESTWWVGFQLRQEIPQVTLDRLARLGIIDRRRDRRLPQDILMAARWELGSQSITVRLVDLSNGGCCILSPEMATEGDRILLVADPEDESCRPVLARICWRRSEGENHVIGCEFLTNTAALELRKALAAKLERDQGTPSVSATKRGSSIPLVLGMCIVAGLTCLHFGMLAPPSFIPEPQLPKASIPEPSTTVSTARSAITPGTTRPQHPLCPSVDRFFDVWQRMKATHGSAADWAIAIRDWWNDSQRP